MAETATAPARATHHISIRHRIGTLGIAVEFTISKPWTVLFGPSGSGKSTILRTIAGLVTPDEGRIVTNLAPTAGEERNCVLLDTASRIAVPSHLRQLRMAPQAASLFPHLTVHQNLIYGFQRRGRQISPSEWEGSVRRTLEIFELVPLARKLPRELSGGEAQRLNLARAYLASDCRLLLLDEPFTGFDPEQQARLLAFLRDYADRQSTTILSVTHDVAEAFQLQAEVIKLRDGKVVAQGPVHEVLEEERIRLLDRLGANSIPLRSSEPFLRG